MPAVRILLCGGTEIVVGACDTMGYVTRSDRAHRTLLGNAEAPWYHTHRRRAPSRRIGGPLTHPWIGDCGAGGRDSVPSPRRSDHGNNNYNIYNKLNNNPTIPPQTQYTFMPNSNDTLPKINKHPTRKT